MSPFATRRGPGLLQPCRCPTEPDPAVARLRFLDGWWAGCGLLKPLQVVSFKTRMLSESIRNSKTSEPLYNFPVVCVLLRVRRD